MAIKEFFINKELISINPKSSKYKYYNNNIFNLIKIYKSIAKSEENIFDTMIYFIVKKIEKNHKNEHIFNKIKMLLKLYQIYYKIKIKKKYKKYDLKEKNIKYFRGHKKSKNKYFFKIDSEKKIVSGLLVDNLFNTLKLKENFMLLDELYYFDDELKPKRRFKIIKVSKLTN